MAFNPLSAISDINRFSQILGVLIKHGFGQIVEQITHSDTALGNIISKFYYTNSLLVDKLRYFPIIAILITSISGISSK